jgi:hypothetical protein
MNVHILDHTYQSRSTTWFRKYKWQKGCVPTSWSSWRVQGGRRRSWPGLYDTWPSPAWFPLKEGIRSNLAPKWSRSQPPLVSCPAATRPSCGRRCWRTSCLLPLAIAVDRHTASSSMHPVQHMTQPFHQPGSFCCRPYRPWSQLLPPDIDAA